MTSLLMQRLQRLETATHGPRLNDDERAFRIAYLLRWADEAGHFSPELQQIATRIRELLARAAHRRDAARTEGLT